MLLTLGIREVLRATPRARIVRIDLAGSAFDYVAGQAVLVGATGLALIWIGVAGVTPDWIDEG